MVIVKEKKMARKIKAITCSVYGTPDVMQLSEIEKPEPIEDEVLVKIHAASVNNWDWDLLTGKPRIYRLLFGLITPKHKVIGSDIAGIVESIGKNVKEFKVGDEVFGDISENGFGAFAEYACVPERMLGKKSGKMSFEQAASIPQAGVMAYQSFHGLKSIKPGQKVLINGAGGGVGSFAIQMAKKLEAEVTAVDKSEKFEFLKNLGADHTIDYRETDYTKTGERYDLIIDVIARRSVFSYKRALAPGGVFYVIGGAVRTFLLVAFIGPVITLFSSKKLKLLVHKPNSCLEQINHLVESEELSPVIDKVFPLTETAEAMEYIGAGKVEGKIIVSVES